MLSQASHASKTESITMLSDENDVNTSHTTANNSTNSSVITPTKSELVLLRQNKLRKTKRLVLKCCERNFKFSSRFVGISAVLADNPDNVTLTDMEALRVECLAKLGDEDVSSSNSSDNSEPGQLRKPIQRRKSRSRHLVDPHSVGRYEPKNPYTLSVAMKHPFVGNPYAQKLEPHYHVESPGHVMGIMPVFQHHSTVSTHPLTEVLLITPVVTFPPGIIPLALTKRLVVWRSLHLHKNNLKVFNMFPNTHLLLTCRHRLLHPEHQDHNLIQTQLSHPHQLNILKKTANLCFLLLLLR